MSEDWSSDANEAINISLHVSDPGGKDEDSKAIQTFHPKFTYPIFGEEERIFGYTGLKINLRFHASTMLPSLQIIYQKRFKPVGDTEPTDLKAAFEAFLPKAAFQKSKDFTDAIKDTTVYNTKWTPPGQLWQSIEAGGKTYEIYRGSLADRAIKQTLTRMQVLVPLFIEGGTFIDVDGSDEELDRWTVFLMYEKLPITEDPHTPYTFVGYSTVYRFYYHQPSTSPAPSVQKPINPSAGFDFKFPIPECPLSNFPCRSRISQFIILPPFQGGGNGSRFYNSIFDYYLQSQHTIEITVEDPNEAFDDMRDINDLIRLRKVPEFAALRINDHLTAPRKGLAPKQNQIVSSVDKIRKDIKIAPRQFSRLVEMQLLSLIPTSIRQSLLPQMSTKLPDQKAKENEYHLWQLLAKQRLYRHNKDSLMQLDRAERIDKLDEVVFSVEADYARLLKILDEREQKKSSKRATPDEADGEPSSKRVKFT